MKGLELQKIRKDLGQTQTELAQTLGVAMRTVQNWEKDVNKIPSTVAQVLLSMNVKSTEYAHKPKGMTEVLTDDLFKSPYFIDSLNKQIVNLFTECIKEDNKYKDGLKELITELKKKVNS